MRKTVMATGVNVATYHGAACPCPTCTPGSIGGRNYDYPTLLTAVMAKQQLAQVAADATALNAALRENDRLPQWVQYKIATGEDRIRAAADYMLARVAAHPEGTEYGAADTKTTPTSLWTEIGGAAGAAEILKTSLLTGFGVLGVLYGSMYLYKRLQK